EEARVVHQHRQDGAELDDDLERLLRLALAAQEVAGEDEMPGRRDGQVFGQPLDDTEEGGDEDGHLAARCGRLERKGTIGVSAASGAGFARPSRRASVCEMRRTAVTFADAPSRASATTTGTNGGSAPCPNRVSPRGASPLMTPR